MNSTLSALDSSVLDFNFISFGNAYFLQEDCPGYPSYDRSDGVPCWQSKCGVDSPPEGCFSGELACQHGDDECAGNAAETCVKHLKPDFKDYMSFAYCYEASFPPSADDISGCAEAIGLTTSDIDACTSDTSLMASLQQTEGYATAQQGIPGTPTVILNGESMSSTRLMLRQVCKAFATLNPSAKSPAGCSSSMKQLRGSVLASSSAI
ncbi:hypothetical protein TL16_g03686 [Triparma laevis f. inornata]|uniref:Thioredoxin-like fold domain-containing protein n=1 Tax=Triparma laevis f. inornata TaxID=1714386 RepID=A0A9W7E5L9_9STRA|nr:hypothetical protein TL16_g03686 [Triparma laevis f. inornata]